MVRDSPGSSTKGTARAPFQVDPAALGEESATLASSPSTLKSSHDASRSAHWERKVASGLSTARAMVPFRLSSPGNQALLMVMIVWLLSRETLLTLPP